MKYKNLQNPIVLAVILLALILAICSCQNNSSFSESSFLKENVSFILPVWPPEYGEQSLYPELTGWLITTNEVRNQAVEASVHEIELTVNKNKPFYVIAQPVTKSTQGQNCFFHCAGGIYPYSYERSGKTGTVNVIWEQGFSAYLMDSMFLSANSICGQDESQISACENYITSFNWKKLVTTIQSKTTIDPNVEEQEVFYNPWHTDLSAIKQGIAYKDFSATLLNQKNCFSVVLQDYGTNESVLSSYIPENEMIHNFSQFSLKKNEENYFSVNNQYQMIIRGSSAKNLSIEYIFLPIIIEE
ncbi:MAG: hypothetical protein J5527_07330 [Treponema sp.]|nr:hypothetical protein [Treponema sp.]